jgi:hypothetical protein
MVQHTDDRERAHHYHEDNSSRQDTGSDRFRRDLQRCSSVCLTPRSAAKLQRSRRLRPPQRVVRPHRAPSIGHPPDERGTQGTQCRPARLANCPRPPPRPVAAAGVSPTTADSAPSDDREDEGRPRFGTHQRSPAAEGVAGATLPPDLGAPDPPSLILLVGRTLELSCEAP